MQMGQRHDEQENSQEVGMVKTAEAEANADAKTSLVVVAIVAIVLLIVGKPIKAIAFGAIMAGAAVNLTLTVIRLVRKAMEKPPE